MKARARTPVALLGLFTLLPAVFGCASSSDAVEKKLASLREEIQKLQNENDRMNERIEAIELRQAREEVKAAEAKTSEEKAAKDEPAVVTRPPLKVLRLSPEGKEDAGAAGGPAADTAPRPLLKGQGKDLELRQGGG